ncbi:hypothetical protein PM082_019485 [Marasmius tenuissimus]|nr:hypothetical protein PM082_019485 [Marasmius tenuissimus]
MEFGFWEVRGIWRKLAPEQAPIHKSFAHERFSLLVFIQPPRSNPILKHAKGKSSEILSGPVQNYPRLILNTPTSYDHRGSSSRLSAQLDNHSRCVALMWDTVSLPVRLVTLGSLRPTGPR